MRAVGHKVENPKKTGGPEIKHNDMVMLIPLISDSGRRFIAGQLDADKYFEEGRRRAERQARDELRRGVANSLRHIFSFFLVDGAAILALAVGMVVVSKDFQSVAIVIFNVIALILLTFNSSRRLRDAANRRSSKSSK
jgi:hypothetical protein